MRILHVTPYAPEAWAYGGIPRLTGALAREFGRRGHHVTICATDACDASSRLPARIETRDGVTLRVFPNLSNHIAYHQQLFLPAGLNAYLRAHAYTFDVAHLHACRNVPGVLAAHHLRRAGVPYLLAPNGTAPRLERRLLIKRVYDRALGRRVLDGANRVLAVTEAERRQLLNLGVAATAIAMAPNPIELDEFATPIARGRFRRAFGLGPSPMILFLGKLTPRKRLDVLVRAAAELRRSDWQLVIAGNDMGAGRTISALIRSLGIEGRTRCVGLLRGRDRLEALADADVVVYASQDEIFGLVPLEALLCGTPVIVADDSGCGEVIASTGGGQVVRMGDVSQLASAIAHTLDEPDRWHAAAAAAAARVRTDYDAGVVCDRLEEIYREMMGDTGSGVPSTGFPRVMECGKPVGDSPDPLPVDGIPDPVAVSFVVPVHNARASIRETLDSVFSQADGRPMEVIAVDDRSDDGSSELLRALAETRPLRIISGPGRGAAAALNAGVAASRYPIICQVDQDVVLQPDWMRLVTAELSDPSVAAAQGQYVVDPRATLAARVMARDLEDRYARIDGPHTTHVCTGNSAYRTEALRAVGLFEETLGYGYDNDMSYRLRDAGYGLRFCRNARSVHRWREGLAGYLEQQYGFGYGRLDLIRKHPRRWTGDSVSPMTMIAHPAVMLMAIGCAAMAMAAAIARVAWEPWAISATVLFASLVIERSLAGVRAARRSGDKTPLWFPLLHIGRDLAWVSAIVTWSARQLSGRRSLPSHSMRGRRSAPRLAAVPAADRILGLIPAHNEAATLGGVVLEIRSRFPDLELLVIDDGSTDETSDLLNRIDVRWIRLPERMGVGSAMRAGLRYASRLGFNGAIRIDGDGQHRASDIDQLLRPITAGIADVALGSRYSGTTTPEHGGPLPKALAVEKPVVSRLLQRILGACISAQTGRRVTDPTSGFSAFGPRALRLLAEHHPTGYPEPELRLFLNRNGLTVMEVPVIARPRLGGTSSLTAARLTVAGARVLLAMIIVPLRATIGGFGRG